MLIFSRQRVSISFQVSPFLVSLSRKANLLICRCSKQIYQRRQNRQMLYSLLQYGLLISLCVYLVNYYASKDVSTHVKVWSVITWVLNFGLALLIPQDVYQTLRKHPDSSETRNLGYQYLLLYWLVYILTWTIIPVLQEWEDAGDLDSTDRLKRSLRSNAIFYLVLLAVSVFFLVLIIMLEVAEKMGLLIFLKCLATMWGMLLLMILLGYSLVEVPRTMWRDADPSDFLQYLYQRIYQMEEEVEQARRQFKHVAAYVSYVRKNTEDPDILRYCDASEDKIPVHLQSLTSSRYQGFITSTHLKYLEYYPISLQNSIEHNKLMKRAIARVERQERGLKEYIVKAILYEDIRDANQNGIWLKSVAKRTSKITSLWYCQIRPVGDKILACLLALFAFVLLISETQVFLSQQSSLLGYLLLFKNLQVIRILVFLVIGLIIYMSNYALFRLKLANLYGLYRKQSDGASLMFATVNFSRVGIAIVFNFFDMIKMRNSVFSTVMQAPQMGLLGQWVLKGLPGILWLIALCHYFNFWSWLARKLGVGSSYSFTSHELVTEGEKPSSPMLVVSKREELQERRSQSVFRELSNI